MYTASVRVSEDWKNNEPQELGDYVVATWVPSRDDINPRIGRREKGEGKHAVISRATPYYLANREVLFVDNNPMNSKECDLGVKKFALTFVIIYCHIDS